MPADNRNFSPIGAPPVRGNNYIRRLADRDFSWEQSSQGCHWCAPSWLYLSSL